MQLSGTPDSGFVGVGDRGPQVDRPHDWIVWHFTHKANLHGIAADGRLRASCNVDPVQNVALTRVKLRRARSVDLAASDPASSVNDHVPFYIAAKSPMLYVVTKGHDGPGDGCTSEPGRPRCPGRGVDTAGLGSCQAHVSGPATPL
ncbi:DarT ssDNA thymidine ADP-ribosyltransferase family protein [Kineosporia mesophila]|uniref:DarT ssDNA thymidine ADP-ribosyltransferase family protein n=1 Tax=Kineosporia mesophila TaxID=566012 RepID=UPI0038B2C6D2